MRTREAKHSVKQHGSNRDKARHSEMLQEQDTVSARSERVRARPSEAGSASENIQCGSEGARYAYTHNVFTCVAKGKKRGRKECDSRYTPLRLGKLDHVIIVRNPVTFAPILTLKR